LDIASILIVFGVVLASLTVHEWAHAWTADHLGDPTARLLGRVSFNPVVHIDPIGTIVLPLLAMFTTGFIFGWAKPVPVNISRFGNPKRDFMIVAAAGPASHLVIATAAALVFRSLGGLESAGDPVMRVLYFAVSINVLLAVFNMLPIPPLDGGQILMALLPPRISMQLQFLYQYGFLILIGLMFTGILGQLIGPPYYLILSWLR